MILFVTFFFTASLHVSKIHKEVIMRRKTFTLKISRIFYFIALLSFIFAAIYVPLRAIIDEEYRKNTEFTIMIFQTFFGLFIINLPSFLEKKLAWQIPPLFSSAFTLFLWGAIFAGEVWEFYYLVPVWDDILHLISSMMAAMLGFSLIDILNSRENLSSLKLSAFFVSAFSVCFAVTMGVLWEIYEFTFDGILGLNMQKFATSSSDSSGILSNLSGRAALVDTMSDLIIDTVGALLVSVFGYISLRLNKGWLNAFKVEINPSDGQNGKACHIPTSPPNK